VSTKRAGWAQRQNRTQNSESNSGASQIAETPHGKKSPARHAAVTPLAIERS
jgi:hypothetical protein